MSLYREQVQTTAPAQSNSKHFCDHVGTRSFTDETKARADACYDAMPGFKNIDAQRRIVARIADTENYIHSRFLDIPAGMGKTYIGIFGLLLYALKKTEAPIAGVSPVVIFVCPPTLASQWEKAILVAKDVVLRLHPAWKIRYAHNPINTYKGHERVKEFDIVLMSTKNRMSVGYYAAYMSGSGLAAHVVVEAFQKVIGRNERSVEINERREKMKGDILKCTSTRALARCVDESHLGLTVIEQGLATYARMPILSLSISATLFSEITKCNVRNGLHDDTHHHRVNMSRRSPFTTTSLVLGMIYPINTRHYINYARFLEKNVDSSTMAHLLDANSCDARDLIDLRADATTLFRDTVLRIFSMNVRIPTLLDHHDANQLLSPELILPAFLSSLNDNMSLEIADTEMVYDNGVPVISMDWLKNAIDLHLIIISAEDPTTARSQEKKKQLIDRVTLYQERIATCYEQSCIVCTETFTPGKVEPVIQICCLQMPMCVLCSEIWRKSSTTCPICRRSLGNIGTVKKRKNEGPEEITMVQAVVHANVTDAIKFALNANPQRELNTVLRKLVKTLGDHAVQNEAIRILLVTSRENAANRMEELFRDIEHVSLVHLRAHGGTKDGKPTNVTSAGQKRTLDRFSDRSIKNVTLLTTVQGHYSNIMNNTTDGLDISGLDGVIYVGTNVTGAQEYQTHARLTRLSRGEKGAFVVNLFMEE